VKTTPAFRRWVRAFAPAALTRKLSRAGVPVSRQTVHRWRRGETAPAPQRAVALLQISEGRLRVEDLYPHPNFVIVDRLMRRER